jgi:hypothetical protein
MTVSAKKKKEYDGLHKTKMSNMQHSNRNIMINCRFFEVLVINNNRSNGTAFIAYDQSNSSQYFSCQSKKFNHPDSNNYIHISKYRFFKQVL